MSAAFLVAEFPPQLFAEQALEEVDPSSEDRLVTCRPRRSG